MKKFDNNIPIAGRAYKAYNDGKITHSREYDVIIDKVVPFDKIDKETKARWEIEKKRCPWIFSEHTDYFAFAKPNEDNVVEIWARTHEGGWFSFSDGFLTYSTLDVQGNLLSEDPNDCPQVNLLNKCLKIFNKK